MGMSIDYQGRSPLFFMIIDLMKQIEINPEIQCTCPMHLDWSRKKDFWRV